MDMTSTEGKLPNLIAVLSYRFNFNFWNVTPHDI